MAKSLFAHLTVRIGNDFGMFRDAKWPNLQALMVWIFEYLIVPSVPSVPAGPGGFGNSGAAIKRRRIGQPIF